jgi:hypothetical protein
MTNAEQSMQSLKHSVDLVLRSTPELDGIIVTYRWKQGYDKLPPAMLISPAGKVTTLSDLVDASVQVAKVQQVLQQKLLEMVQSIVEQAKTTAEVTDGVRSEAKEANLRAQEAVRSDVCNENLGYFDREGR